MNTKFRAGLYKDGAGGIWDMAEHGDEGMGWLAHPVQEIIKRTSSTGGFEVEVLREKKGAKLVSIEIWIDFQPFEVDMTPDTAKLRKIVRARDGKLYAEQPSEGDAGAAA